MRKGTPVQRQHVLRTTASQFRARLNLCRSWATVLHRGLAPALEPLATTFVARLQLPALEMVDGRPHQLLRAFGQP